MKSKWMMAALMMAVSMVFVSCGNNKKQQAQQAEEQVAAMSIDDVMAKAAELVDQQVVIY